MTSGNAELIQKMSDKVENGTCRARGRFVLGFFHWNWCRMGGFLQSSMIFYFSLFLFVSIVSSACPTNCPTCTASGSCTSVSPGYRLSCTTILFTTTCIPQICSVGRYSAGGTATSCTGIVSLTS